MDTYVSKVTAAGQLTLPKEVRRHLRLGERGEYVEVAVVGEAAVIRRLREEDALFRDIDREVRKSGITRARMREILEGTRKATWRRRHGTALR